MLPIDIVIAFLVIFVLILIVTWATQLRTGTPSIGTPRQVVAEMIRLAELTGTETVYDIGAGDGRLLIAAKRAFPGIRAIGYENALGVWMLGKLRILLARKSVRLRFRDAFRENFADADVIFLYVVPEMMARLKEKFDSELRPGTRVVSSTFRFQEKDPITEGKAPGWVGEKKIFVYRW